MYHNDTQRTADVLDWRPETFADLTLQINRARTAHVARTRVPAAPSPTPTRAVLLAVL